MNDKEMLELAAKAAGKNFVTDDNIGFAIVDEYGFPIPWDPLAEDGDALRLAVKLRLTVSWDRFDDSDYATATPPHTHQGYDCIADQDPCAAARRAITRAAAEIGRKM